MQEAVILAKSDVLEKEDIILRNRRNSADTGKDNMSLADVEKEHITHILRNSNWDKQKAGEILKISRPTLNKKINEYNIVNEK